MGFFRIGMPDYGHGMAWHSSTRAGCMRYHFCLVGIRRTDRVGFGMSYDMVVQGARRSIGYWLGQVVSITDF